MEGIDLAARFSSAPNSLGLCGPKGFSADDRKRLKAQLKRFLAPYAYLSLIANANGLKPFDYDVVEAFWLGNRLLRNVERKDVAKTILKKFTGKGRLSPLRAKSLAENLPDEVYPHHSFHVFYIGSISGVLEGKKKELDLCRISWGRVSRVGKSTIAACSRPVIFKGGEAILASRKSTSWVLPQNSHYDVGDIACSHWGVAVTKISKEQERNLKDFTMENLALYRARPQGA